MVGRFLVVASSTPAAVQEQRPLRVHALEGRSCISIDLHPMQFQLSCKRFEAFMALDAESESYQKIKKDLEFIFPSELVLKSKKDTDKITSLTTQLTEIKTRIQTFPSCHECKEVVLPNKNNTCMVCGHFFCTLVPHEVAHGFDCVNACGRLTCSKACHDSAGMAAIMCQAASSSSSSSSSLSQKPDS